MGLSICSVFTDTQTMTATVSRTKIWWAEINMIYYQKPFIFQASNLDYSKALVQDLIFDWIPTKQLVEKPFTTTLRVGSYWLCHQLDLFDSLTLFHQIIIFPASSASSNFRHVFSLLFSTIICPLNQWEENVNDWNINLSFFTSMKSFLYPVLSGFCWIVIWFLQFL